MKTMYYPNTDKFLISVDCIIFGFNKKDLYVLLTRRPVEPRVNEWSLMGGFMEEGESLLEAAEKVLYRYTQQQQIYMEQVSAYGDVNRDSGGRVISVAFYALVKTENFNTTLAKRFDAKWIKVKELPKLVFDHNKMIMDALTLLQYKVSSEPVAFNFFDDKFTLPALQELYEAIYQMKLDKRNFRKKLTSMEILDRLQDKDKKNSKRGAYYYIYNKHKYNKFLASGKRFSL